MSVITGCLLPDRDIRGTKTYGSSSGLEHGQLAGSAIPAVGGHNRLEDLGGDVPQLLVLGAKEDDDAVGLGVEGGGHLVEQVLDDLLHTSRCDGQVLGERVVGPASLGEVDDSLGVGGHGGWFGGCKGTCVSEEGRRLGE